MIEWYSNKYVEIYFDDIPKVAIRYILPFQTKDKKKSVNLVLNYKKQDDDEMC